MIGFCVVGRIRVEYDGCGFGVAIGSEIISVGGMFAVVVS